MIDDITTAVITALSGLSGLSGVAVVAAYDNSKNVEDSNGKIVIVNASSEVMSSLANGKPMAWRVNLNISSETHCEADKNGAIRKGMSAAIFAWMKSLTSLTVTGYRLDGVLDVAEGETGQSGENYATRACTGTLIISSTT